MPNFHTKLCPLWCKTLLISRLCHVYVSLNRIIIGLDNGLLSVWRQAIIWTNAEISLIATPETAFNEKSVGLKQFAMTGLRFIVSFPI